MVRETRYLWVGNIPERITEEKITEHFQRHGKIQSVKVHQRHDGEQFHSATVAFTDIKSAAKAHSSETRIENALLRTEYSDSPTGACPISVLRAAGTDTSSSGLSKNPPVKRYENDETLQKNQGTTRPVSASGRHGKHMDRLCNSGQSSPSNSVESGRFNNNCGGRNLSWKVANMSPSHCPSRSRSPSVGSTSHSSRSRSRERSPSIGHMKDLSYQIRCDRNDTNGNSLSSSDQQDTNSIKAPLGICIHNLPLRSSDTSLHDGLYHEYKKIGRVTVVRVLGHNDDRYAIISFRKPEDAQKAYEISQDKLFFGHKIRVTIHDGIEVDDSDVRYTENEMDEYHPKATRTLFVGNLDRDIGAQELEEHFKIFGQIIEIDVKRPSSLTNYAFVQYADITSVVKALNQFSGESIGSNKVKLGFGKSMTTSCVWLDNLAESVTERFLVHKFSRFGDITDALIDKVNRRGLVYCENNHVAQFALNEMRGAIFYSKKIMIDYASRECQNAFIKSIVKTGQLDSEELEGRYYRQQNYEYYNEPYRDDRLIYSGRSYYDPHPTHLPYPPHNGVERFDRYIDPPYYDEEPSPYRIRRYYGSDNDDPYLQDLKDFGYRQIERNHHSRSPSPLCDRISNDEVAKSRLYPDHTLSRFTDDKLLHSTRQPIGADLRKTLSDKDRKSSTPSSSHDISPPHRTQWASNSSIPADDVSPELLYEKSDPRKWIRERGRSSKDTVRDQDVTEKSLLSTWKRDEKDTTSLLVDNNRNNVIGSKYSDCIIVSDCLKLDRISKERSLENDSKHDISEDQLQNEKRLLLQELEQLEYHVSDNDSDEIRQKKVKSDPDYTASCKYLSDKSAKSGQLVDGDTISNYRKTDCSRLSDKPRYSPIVHQTSAPGCLGSDGEEKETSSPRDYRSAVKSQSRRKTISGEMCTSKYRNKSNDDSSSLTNVIHDTVKKSKDMSRSKDSSRSVQCSPVSLHDQHSDHRLICEPDSSKSPSSVCEPSVIPLLISDSCTSPPRDPRVPSKSFDIPQLQLPKFIKNLPSLHTRTIPLTSVHTPSTSSASVTVSPSPTQTTITTTDSTCTRSSFVTTTASSLETKPTTSVKNLLDVSSDLSSDSSPTKTTPSEDYLSVEERIRRIDEKLNRKVKIKKRVETLPSTLPATLPDKRSEPSDNMKWLLSRTSVFDQDIKRLESSREMYDDLTRSCGSRLKTPGKDSANYVRFQSGPFSAPKNYPLVPGEGGAYDSPTLPDGTPNYASVFSVQSPMARRIIETCKPPEHHHSSLTPIKTEMSSSVNSVGLLTPLTPSMPSISSPHTSHCFVSTPPTPITPSTSSRQHILSDSSALVCSESSVCHETVSASASQPDSCNRTSHDTISGETGLSTQPTVIKKDISTSLLIPSKRKSSDNTLDPRTKHRSKSSISGPGLFEPDITIKTDSDKFIKCDNASRDDTKIVSKTDYKTSDKSSCFSDSPSFCSSDFTSSSSSNNTSCDKSETNRYTDETREDSYKVSVSGHSSSSLCNLDMEGVTSSPPQCSKEADKTQSKVQLISEHSHNEMQEDNDYLASKSTKITDTNDEKTKSNCNNIKSSKCEINSRNEKDSKIGAQSCPVKSSEKEVSTKKDCEKDVYKHSKSVSSRDNMEIYNKSNFKESSSKFKSLDCDQKDTKNTKKEHSDNKHTSEKDRTIKDKVEINKKHKSDTNKNENRDSSSIQKNKVHSKDKSSSRDKPPHRDFLDSDKISHNDNFDKKDKGNTSKAEIRDKIIKDRMDKKSSDRDNKSDSHEKSLDSHHKLDLHDKAKTTPVKKDGSKEKIESKSKGEKLDNADSNLITNKKDADKSSKDMKRSKEHKKDESHKTKERKQSQSSTQHNRKKSEPKGESSSSKSYDKKDRQKSLALNESDDDYDTDSEIMRLKDAKKKAEQEKRDFEMAVALAKQFNYESMYDKVKRRSNKENKEREVNAIRDRLNLLQETRKRKSKHSDESSDEDDPDVPSYSSSKKPEMKSRMKRYVFNTSSDEEMPATCFDSKPSKPTPKAVPPKVTKKPKAGHISSSSSEWDPHEDGSFFMKMQKVRKKKLKKVYSSDSNGSDVDVKPATVKTKNTIKVDGANKSNSLSSMSPTKSKPHNRTSSESTSIEYSKSSKSNLKSDLKPVKLRESDSESDSELFGHSTGTPGISSKKHEKLSKKHTSSSFDNKHMDVSQKADRLKHHKKSSKSVSDISTKKPDNLSRSISHSSKDIMNKKSSKQQDSSTSNVKHLSDQPPILTFEHSSVQESVATPTHKKMKPTKAALKEMDDSLKSVMLMKDYVVSDLKQKDDLMFNEKPDLSFQFDSTPNVFGVANYDQGKLHMKDHYNRKKENKSETNKFSTSLKSSSSNENLTFDSGREVSCKSGDTSKSKSEVSNLSCWYNIIKSDSTDDFKCKKKSKKSRKSSNTVDSVKDIKLESVDDTSLEIKDMPQLIKESPPHSTNIVKSDESPIKKSESLTNRHDKKEGNWFDTPPKERKSPKSNLYSFETENKSTIRVHTEKTQENIQVNETTILCTPSSKPELGKKKSKVTSDSSSSRNWLSSIHSSDNSDLDDGSKSNVRGNFHSPTLSPKQSFFPLQSSDDSLKKKSGEKSKKKRHKASKSKDNLHSNQSVNIPSLPKDAKSHPNTASQSLFSDTEEPFEPLDPDMFSLSMRSPLAVDKHTKPRLDGSNYDADSFHQKSKQKEAKTSQDPSIYDFTETDDDNLRPIERDKLKHKTVNKDSSSNLTTIEPSRDDPLGLTKIGVSSNMSTSDFEAEAAPADDTNGPTAAEVELESAVASILDSDLCSGIEDDKINTNAINDLDLSKPQTNASSDENAENMFIVENSSVADDMMVSSPAEQAHPTSDILHDENVKSKKSRKHKSSRNDEKVKDITADSSSPPLKLRKTENLSDLSVASTETKPGLTDKREKFFGELKIDEDPVKSAELLDDSSNADKNLLSPNETSPKKRKRNSSERLSSGETTATMEGDSTLKIGADHSMPVTSSIIEGIQLNVNSAVTTSQTLTTTMSHIDKIIQDVSRGHFDVAHTSASTPSKRNSRTRNKSDERRSGDGEFPKIPEQPVTNSVLQQQLQSRHPYPGFNGFQRLMDYPPRPIQNLPSDRHDQPPRYLTPNASGYEFKDSLHYDSNGRFQAQMKPKFSDISSHHSSSSVPGNQNLVTMPHLHNYPHNPASTISQFDQSGSQYRHAEANNSWMQADNLTKSRRTDASYMDFSDPSKEAPGLFLHPFSQGSTSKLQHISPHQKLSPMMGPNAASPAIYSPGIQPSSNAHRPSSVPNDSAVPQPNVSPHSRPPSAHSLKSMPNAIQPSPDMSFRQNMTPEAMAEHGVFISPNQQPSSLGHSANRLPPGLSTAQSMPPPQSKPTSYSRDDHQGVHIGIVQPHPQHIDSSEACPTGQIIERIPNHGFKNAGVTCVDHRGSIIQQVDLSKTSKDMDSARGLPQPDGNRGGERLKGLQPSQPSTCSQPTHLSHPGPSPYRRINEQVHTSIEKPPAAHQHSREPPKQQYGVDKLDVHGSGQRIHTSSHSSPYLRPNQSPLGEPCNPNTYHDNSHLLPSQDIANIQKRMYRPEFHIHPNSHAAMTFAPGGAPIGLTPQVIYRSSVPQQQQTFLASPAPDTGLMQAIHHPIHLQQLLPQHAAIHMGQPRQHNLETTPPGMHMNTHITVSQPGPSPTLLAYPHSSYQDNVNLSHFSPYQVGERQQPDIDSSEPPHVFLQRYPVLWQGLLALKNDSCVVQMHFVAGTQALVKLSMPIMDIDGGALRIAQRMRLDPAQLDGVAKRMQLDQDFCMLLALPCGRDRLDFVQQSRQLTTGFIEYLQQKQAAGIVNVALDDSEQTSYVVHIFPPCNFSNTMLNKLSFDLYKRIEGHEHMVIIITTV